MIRVDDLRKAYDGFVAVDGSTFEVAAGEVFGVVGPNGAGKTTTLKMLAGLVEPTSGRVEVAGASAGSLDMRRNLGFLPEESPLYEEMTAITYLEFFADLSFCKERIPAFTPGVNPTPLLQSAVDGKIGYCTSL